ncbi:lipid-transfer protein [Nocardia sp. NBC_01329]|uniref:lipid-transfer protein n=1 Tax=Nocardia sp. NBC_01329 TaxID=2903594 RepID=UPI002E1025F6|nr:lipid-transfer protein [Nocardia sp. NBC_01329]
MRDIAVVAFAQSPGTSADRRDDMAEILLPVMREALGSAGIDRTEVDFWASGSHDFHEGRTFAYIESLDAVGAWPPISESHVEMDAAWAAYEAWSWLQLGEGEIAVVYGVGRGSLATDLDQVTTTQLDPYFLAPLRPHQDALAALQAQALVAAGMLDEKQMAEVVVRARAAGMGEPGAQVSGEVTVDELLAAPYLASPLREHDRGPIGDAAAVLVLAAGDTARRLAGRPAWVRGADHRMDTHYPGTRDLTRVDTVTLAAAKAADQAGFAAREVQIAELHTEYSYQEPLLTNALELSGATVNPGGGPLVARPTTATGLIRIGAAAQHILSGRADRTLAHATSGPALQQNMICLLEGDR